MTLIFYMFLVWIDIEYRLGPMENFIFGDAKVSLLIFLFNLLVDIEHMGI